MKIKVEIDGQDYIIEKTYSKKHPLRIWINEPIENMKGLSIMRTAVNCVLIGMTYNNEEMKNENKDRTQPSSPE